MLILEIEYLAGVAFAAVGPDSDQPDWPPQPDRIFSALVATWAAAHGQDDDEAEALEWLEALPPPVIQASPALQRTAPDVFVPPNDPRSDKQKHAKGVLPTFRSRQPRRFPAARPDDPVVRLYWDEAWLSEATFDVLQRLARDTAYVGHSASLARCWFRREGDGDGSARLQAVAAERRVYAGRLAELRQRFDAGHRPSPGSPVTPPAPAVVARANLFSDRWLILEHVAGDMPDIRASGIVARAVRDVLLSGYKQIGLGNAIGDRQRPRVRWGAHLRSASRRRPASLRRLPLCRRACIGLRSGSARPRRTARRRRVPARRSCRGSVGRRPRPPHHDGQALRRCQPRSTRHDQAVTDPRPERGQALARSGALHSRGPDGRYAHADRARPSRQAARRGTR